MAINECEARISKNQVADAIATGPVADSLIREQIVESLITCKRCDISKPFTERGFGQMGLDDAMINSDVVLGRFRETSCPLKGNYGNS